MNTREAPRKASSKVTGRAYEVTCLVQITLKTIVRGARSSDHACEIAQDRKIAPVCSPQDRRNAEDSWVPACEPSWDGLLVMDDGSTSEAELLEEPPK